MNKIVLIPILIALVIYIAIFQTIPSVMNVLDLREQRVEKIKEVKENEEKLKKLKSFQNDVVTHQGQFDFVSNFVPKDPTENDFINFLNQKAEDTGVSLFNIEPTDKIIKKRREDSSVANINYSEAEITLTGSYESVRNFLNEIFVINRLYKFDTILIEKIIVKGGESSPDSLSVKIVVNYAYVSDSLAMRDADVNGLSGTEGARKSYDFVDFVVDSTADIKDFNEADSTRRKNPFSPN